MRYRPDHRWLSRRMATGYRSDESSARPAAGRPGGRLGGFDLDSLGLTVNEATPTPDPLAELKADPPGPDGVRRRLVDRVRQMIADGAYDTPDRWAAAEERLVRRATDRRL